MSYLTPAYRPSIRELSKFLLSPQTPHRSSRCMSNISRQARYSTPHPRIVPAPRHLSTSAFLSASPKPKHHDRGPASTEDTQTDFGAMNVLGHIPQPSTSIDACLYDGFHLNSGVKITEGSGVLLVGGEAFNWRPWEAGSGDMRLVNKKGQWDVEDGAWGLLGLVWPKPGRPTSVHILDEKVLTLLQICSFLVWERKCAQLARGRDNTSTAWVSGSRYKIRGMLRLNSTSLLPSEVSVMSQQL